VTNERSDQGSTADAAGLPNNGASPDEWPSGSTPPVLTVDELATLLRVDRKTVYAAISRGEIPGVRRIRKAYRIHRDTVLTWLRSGQGRDARQGSRR
jgi:excisionase family DNA binding protein